MNPWTDAAIAEEMAQNVQRQLAEVPWPVHFTAYSDAVRAMSNERDGQGEKIWKSVLEIGCGTGHGVAILKSARVDYDGFSGIDINEHAISVARQLYRDCLWYCADASTLATFEKRDIVIDGSLVLHVDDWRTHLAALCAVSKDAVILHRLPIHVGNQNAPTGVMETHGYGRTFKAWRFDAAQVQGEMAKHGFRSTEARMAHGDSATITFRRVER